MSIFGTNVVVQLPTPAPGGGCAPCGTTPGVPGAPVLVDTTGDGRPDWNISLAKEGRACFPPLDKSYLQNELNDNHLTGEAFAALVKPQGYKLHEVNQLWADGKITDKGVYTVATQGLVPPPDVVRLQEILGPIKNPAISAIADPAGAGAADEVATETSCATTTKFNVPDGFDPVFFVSEWSLIDGQTEPAELNAKTAILSITKQHHVIGSTKSDGSKDHEVTWAVRAETRAAALAAISAGVVQWYVGVTLKRQ